MCRICGRMVRCIFDTMPSRTLSWPRSTNVAGMYRSNLQAQRRQPISSRSQILSARSTRPLSTTAPAILQLPFRSRLHTTSTQQATIDPSISLPNSDSAEIPPSMLQPQAQAAVATITTTIDAPIIQESTASQPLVLSKSLQSLLPALKAQTPHYISAHIHSFPYLLTEGDTLRLPFVMHGVSPGDVLRFNRATVIGSRDYTLKAGFSSPQHSSPPHVRGEAFVNKRRTGEPNYIDERLFECRMRVMGLDSAPLMVKEKKKRRIRRTKKAASKHKYTVLKVMEIRVKSLDELTTMPKEQVVLE